MMTSVSARDKNFSKAYLGDSIKYEMTVSELQNCDSIHVLICGYVPNEYDVIGFEMAYVKPGIDFWIQSQSGLFTPKQKEVVLNCEGGEKIYFSDIKIKIKETDSIISVNSFQIEIKAPWSYAIVDLNRPYVISSSDNDFELIDDVLEIDSIIVADPKSPREIVKDYYQVTSFDIYSTGYFYHRIEGNKLTPELRKDIKRLKKYKLANTHMIRINNIKYKNDTGDEFSATPIAFKMTTFGRKKYRRLEKHDGRLSIKNYE
jgi:hypothetical protein